MLDTTTTRFSHVKPADTAWRSDGLRAFFQYQDLGIEQATAGRVIAQRVRANLAPEKGTREGHQRPGIVHYLFDYSPDMEYIEIVGPADFTSIDATGPCAVPAAAPWASL